MMFRTIKEAFRNIFRHGWLSFSAVLSMMLTLLLTSVLVIISLNIQNATTVIAQGLETVVLLEKDVSDEKITDMLAEIKQMNNVKQVTYETAEEVFANFIANEENGDKLLYLQPRVKDVMNDQITITMVESDAYGALEKSLTKQYPKEIQEFVFNEEVAETILPMFEWIRKAALWLIMAVALVAVILISNTIRITIVARRREIEIMRLVAASNWYIRTPFIIEGILLGIIGALIATAISVGAYWYYLPILTSQVFEMSNEIFVSAELVLYQSLIWTLGIGATIGFIGSIFPVRKYLKK